MLKVYPLRVGEGIFINYTYLLTDETTKEAIIIDPGWEFETVKRCLYETKCDLKAILLTHHHADHTGLASRFANQFSIPVLMGAVEMDYYNFRCLNLISFPPDRMFYIGGFEIFPHLTPGHTKGSICFQIANYLFTGDTLFVEGCGICTGEHGAKEMFDSLQRLKSDIGRDVIIYPGHSFGITPGVTFSYLLTQNIYCHFNEASTFVAFRLRKNQKGLFNFK